MLFFKYLDFMKENFIFLNELIKIIIVFKGKFLK